MIRNLKELKYPYGYETKERFRLRDHLFAGGGGCDFDIFGISNGPDVVQASSVWSCSNSADEEFFFSIFADGTGISDDIGEFTWVETGCRSIFVDGEQADGDITNTEGSLASGVLSFDEAVADGSADSAGCVAFVLIEN